MPFAVCCSAILGKPVAHLVRTELLQQAIICGHALWFRLSTVRCGVWPCPCLAGWLWWKRAARIQTIASIGVSASRARRRCSTWIHAVSVGEARCAAGATWSADARSAPAGYLHHTDGAGDAQSLLGQQTDGAATIRYLPFDARGSCSNSLRRYG